MFLLDLKKYTNAQKIVLVVASWCNLKHINLKVNWNGNTLIYRP